MSFVLIHGQCKYMYHKYTTKTNYEKSVSCDDKTSKTKNAAEAIHELNREARSV